MTNRTARRRVLQIGGAGLVATFAGCLGGDDDGDTGTDDDPTDSSDDDTSDDTDDREDGPGSEGLLYAFAPDQITLIDPADGSVLEELTDDVSGLEWGDPRITSDHGQIFVAEGSRAQVVVIDTEHREIEGRVDVGPDPLHVYAPTDGEIWAHSDDEGAFYVIDTDSLEVLEVVDAVEGGGHGKLLFHEELDGRAYAGTVSESAVVEVDLEDRSVGEVIDVGDGGGTHYKAYAPETGLAYFERSGLGMTAVVDLEAGETVDEFGFAGGMYLTPDEDVLALLDGETVRLYDATSEETDEIETISVEGEPAAIRFYDGEDGLYAFTANSETPDIAVLDLEAGEELDRFETGETDGSYRPGVAGDEYFFTTSDADGTVAIVDMATQELVDQVEAGDGVDTLQYVGDSGVGYTSR